MRNTKVHHSPTYIRLLAMIAVGALTVLTPALRAQDPGYNDPQQGSQADPPSIVGRLSVLQGNVSLQSAGQNFAAAELNYPLTSGDRLYTDNGARGEVEAGQLLIRVGQQTDFTVTALNDQLAQFGLGQGSVHLRTFALDPANVTELDTPNASVTVLQPGDTRVDVFPQDNLTVVTVLSGQAQVNADGLQQVMQPGQSLEIAGSNPSRAQFVGRPRPDDLDRFNGQRDAAYQRAFASEGAYVSADTIGADDLAGYGDWDNSADYGPVWYPRSVAVDWSPYSDGHWANIAPWGWTWVGAEPWGFAPYHYGRWNRFGDRWGWVPGPRVVRPVYSPALVVFVGGSGFSAGGLSISIGGGGGGVAAWFPLGPREVYHPWYRSSPVYVNRVNVTNIYNRNTVEVRNIYNRRDDVYPNNHPAAYVNRSVATVAIPQRNFGNGRSVRESAIHADPRQFQNAPIMNRPPVAAQQQVTARPAAVALPPRVERPAFDTRGNGNPNAQGGRSNFGGRPAQPQGQPAAQQGFQPGGRPDRGNNPQPVIASPTEAARPGTVQPVQPGRDATPGANASGGRFGNGRPSAQPVPSAAAAQPAPSAQPAQPVRDGNPVNGNAYGDRGRSGRVPVQPYTAPAQPLPAAQPAPAVAPTQPVREGNQGNGNGGNGSGNDRRFGNRNPAPAAQPVQPYTAPAPQPVRQPPAPVAQPAAPGGQSEYARPGPRREAPDAPIRMEPRPQPTPQQQQPAPQPRPQPAAPPQRQPAPQPQKQPPAPPRPVTPSDDKKK